MDDAGLACPTASPGVCLLAGNELQPGLHDEERCHHLAYVTAWDLCKVISIGELHAGLLEHIGKPKYIAVGARAFPLEGVLHLHRMACKARRWATGVRSTSKEPGSNCFSVW
jgi:hypothetical protein